MQLNEILKIYEEEKGTYLKKLEANRNSQVWIGF